MRVGGGRRERCVRLQWAPLQATGVQVVFAGEGGAKQSGTLDVLWSVGFEHVSPVRSFGSFQGQRSFQGS